jgi:hypothetical protein
MRSIRHPNQFTRALLRGLVVLLAALVTAPAALANQRYQNPFDGDTYYTGRTDMGVDFCLHRGDPIRAVGPGTVTGIEHDWAGGQPYLWYELTRGPDTGLYVYIAEQITHLARVGAKFSAGHVLARYARKGTCIETGWATASGQTLASATTGYTEGQVTKAGVLFARFLIGLGVQGTFELKPMPPPPPPPPHKGHPTHKHPRPGSPHHD